MAYLERRGQYVTKNVVHLRSGDAIAFFDDRFKLKNKDLDYLQVEQETYKKGDVLTLCEEECDGFDAKEKEYEVVAALKEYNGIPIDSIIVKQVGGEAGTIFSMTKSDCKTIGIKFEDGLQLMSDKLSWKKKGVSNAKVDKEFSSFDLSTYPVDFGTKAINRMAVKIFIGQRCMTNDIEHVSVKTKIPLILSNGETIPRSTNIPFRLLKNHINSYFDSNGNFYIELDFAQNEPKGIVPNELSGKEFSDVFDISWVEYKVVNRLAYI